MEQGDDNQLKIHAVDHEGNRNISQEVLSTDFNILKEIDFQILCVNCFM